MSVAGGDSLFARIAERLGVVPSFVHKIFSMASDALYVLGAIGFGLAVMLDWISDPVIMRRLMAVGVVFGLLVGFSRIMVGIENWRYMRRRRQREENWE